MYKNAFITYDNNLYYLGSDSKMAIGWQSIGGNTYYFRNWGGMITGKQVIDGKTYVFDEDGKLVQSPTDLNRPRRSVSAPYGTF